MLRMKSEFGNGCFIYCLIWIINLDKKRNDAYMDVGGRRVVVPHLTEKQCYKIIN